MRTRFMCQKMFALLSDVRFPKNTFDFKKNKVLLARQGIDYPVVALTLCLLNICILR